MEEEKIKTAEKDFLYYVDNLKLFLEYQEKFFDSFLNIKLAFLTFVGIIITIVFNQKDNFSRQFLIILVSILIISFIFLVIDLLVKFLDTTNAIKKQHKRTMLAKIRHIAIMRGTFKEYGSRAEELLTQEEKTEQKMLNNESLKEIIKYPRNILPVIIFILWLLIIISVPTLFLLEILGKL